MSEPVRGGVTETPESEAPAVTIHEELSASEQTWLQHQRAKRSGQSSKFVPHQGAKERARRLRRRAT